MKVIFDKLAKLELDDASEYYEFEVPGLGDRFREEVKRGIRRICEYPSSLDQGKGRCEEIPTSQVPVQDSLLDRRGLYLYYCHCPWPQTAKLLD